MKISQPTFMIRISRSWHEGIPEDGLYEVTRGVWKIGARREQAELAFAVAGGIVLVVNRVHSWRPAGSTPYQTRSCYDVAIEGRWEFVGEVTESPYRDRYKGADLSGYFQRGSNNPILYVNIG